MIFYNKCNKDPYNYYTVDKFKNTEEEAAYSYPIVKDVNLQNFILFLFEVKEETDGYYILGEKTSFLISSEIKGIEENSELIGSICAPTNLNFTSFISIIKKIIII